MEKITTPQEEFFEIVSTREGKGTVNTSTGEVTMLFDPEVPLEQKVNSFSFVLDTLDSQIEIHKKYVNKHKNKIEKILLFQDKLRKYIKEQMIEKGISNLKTEENTLYFINKPKLRYNIEDIPNEMCLVEVKGQIKYQEAIAFVNDNPNVGVEIIKKKPIEEEIPSLVKQGLISPTIENILCRR